MSNDDSGHCGVFFSILLILGNHVPEKIDNSVRIPPFIIIPGDNLVESLLSLQVILEGCGRVIDRRMAVMNEISGDEFFFRVFEDALQVCAGGFLHQGINLVNGGVPG
jgi:hypothetical protein